MIRRVWIKTIGDNASIAITDHGKRRVTLPNSSTSAAPRPLRRAENGPLFPADDLGCETTSLRVSQFCALLRRFPRTEGSGPRGQTRKACNDMRTTWCMALFAASAIMGTIDVLHAQPEENAGRNEFLRSCASCHGVSGKGDGPVAKSLSSPPSDLTRLSEANNGVFPVSRVHEVIDGRIERLVHGTRDMPVWGDRYMREMTSPEAGGWVSKEWDETIVRRRILALVEYISTLQRATRRSR